jgi:hypothetical protein
LDKGLQDKITKVYFYLSLLELVIEPVMLLFNLVRGQHCGQPTLPHLLEQIFLEFVLATLHTLEVEDWAWQAAAQNWIPAEDLLLYHLEETLRVDRCNLDFSLQTSHFVRPWHWLADQPIRPKLHQGLIHWVENALVEDVDRLPYLLGSFVSSCLPFSKLHFALLFNVDIQSHRRDRVLLIVPCRLEMPVAAQVWLLKQLETVNRGPSDRLGQLFEELDVVIVIRTHLVVKLWVFAHIINIKL